MKQIASEERKFESPRARRERERREKGSHSPLVDTSIAQGNKLLEKQLQKARVLEDAE